MNWGPQQIRWAKRLDALFAEAVRGRGRCSDGPCPLPDPGQVRRVLFVKFWGLGSIVLTQPALRLLAGRYPHAEIHFLTAQDHRKLLELIPEVHEAHCLDARHGAGLIWNAAWAVPRLRGIGFDLVFDGEFLAAFSGWLCRAIRPRRSVGFGLRSGEDRGHDISVPYHPDWHTVTQFLNLVSAESRTVAPAPPLGHAVPRPRLRLPESSLVLLRPYVVLNINASPLALERRWPRRRFLKLARAILSEFDLDLVLIGSAREHAYVAEFTSELDAQGRVRNLAGRLDLVQLAELVSGSVALVSNDSGPVHLASAFDTPVVAFFGPESPRRYGPLSTQRLVFYQDLPCSPCMNVENAKTVNCRHQVRCMRELREAPVIARVTQFLGDVLDEGDRVPKVGRGGHV